MAQSLKEERIVTPEETGAIGGTPPEGICRKLPDGTLIRCLGEFVEQGSVKIESEDKVLKVSHSEKPRETEQPQEDKMSMEKTDAHPNDEAKRKSKNKSVMCKKQSEVAVVQDPTSAKLDPEKSDRHDITGDGENVHGADRVESENSKDKEGKPNPKINKMQLKYSYREDQWSPVNPEGKKQYDRDFLLQFQKECTYKPDGLPNIPDIVLDRAVVQPLTLIFSQCGNQKSSDFMPHFMLKSRHVQPNMALTEDQKKKKRGKELERERERKKKEKVLSIYSHPDIKPMLSPWKCGRYDAESEKLYRSITSILNKLTPQLFTKLTDKALQLPIDTEEQLKGVIALIFEKAISEPIYSTAYAHMCQKLSTLKVQTSGNPGQIVQFHPILVHNCQQEFEKESEIDEVQRRKEISQLPANQQEAELELLQEQIIYVKRRKMGNIRFTGELYKLRILTENIMHNCIMKLLKAKDDDSLECLCLLMSTIGKDLDHEKAKNRMDQYFNKINKIIASQKNQPRIRFLMWDLVDLRKNKWVPRRQESKPTTIDALHREWDIAEAKNAEEFENYNGPSGRRKQALHPRTVTPQADDGWNTITSTNKTRTAYDPAKLKLTRMTHRPFHPQLYPQAYPPTTPPYYSSPPQPLWMNAAAQSTPRQLFPSQPAATRPDGQRKKNIIRVVYPTTDQDVTETSFSNDNAKKIQTQFASKVAVVVSDIPQPTDLSQSHRVPPAPQQPQSKQPNYPTGQANRSSQEPLKMTHRPFHQQLYPQAYSPTTPAYYSSPPQQVWLKTAHTTPRQESTSQPPATESDGQQRSAKNFRLVDPTTNKDVPERRMHDSSGSSSPHSGRSNANDTPSVDVEFTLDGASAADKGLNSVSSQGDQLHVFKRGLTSLLNERPDNNQIFDWIEGNISHTQKQHSEFIRALVTIICQNTARGVGQSCRIDAEILKLRCPVLQRYIDNKFLLELQALYAVQALNHSLHSPPGLLRILFDVLYDEDVVTEEAFYNWKISDDPKESDGKDMALKSVRSFFTWLAEPEAEAN